MINIFWFRRDLRLEDNAGLYHALAEGLPVLAVFIFDENILQKTECQSDKRITFIYDEVCRLKTELEKLGSSFLILQGKPEDLFEELAKTHAPRAVFTNNDYEPYARERDASVERLLKRLNIGFHTFKDQVIFEKDEVVKDSGEPYTVFTPYSKKWKSLLLTSDYSFFDSSGLKKNFLETKPFDLPDISSMGFERASPVIPPREINPTLIRDYHKTRDFPALEGTSRLSVHLRFGTISIRQLVKVAAETNEIYLNELIWREFYMMILWHFPRVVAHSFKSQYDNIDWRNDEKLFVSWCEGKTGYPIVDAGMRELSQTGFMHNRLRMITASFLTKHLLTDWRLGEAYFAGKLLDYELASNNGGWQWAAGTGCDAAPYFRVFNPELQALKFDPDKIYIRKWVPELKANQYIPEIVTHSEARNIAIKAYKKAIQK
jgi:deoxyribodipyrimidine photo-lyase